jgi:hypothetical protein
MLKKTIIAVAALGIVGSVAFTPSAPAEAFFLCAKNSKNAQSERCLTQAQRRADRKAKWADFWQSMRIGHRKKSG